MMYFIIFILFFCAQHVHSYPNGAPTSACTSMMPDHHSLGSSPCQPLYVIEANTTIYSVNDAIQITVRCAASTDYFKGILLLARDQHNGQILGYWSSTPSVQTINCNGISNSAITHISSMPKSEVRATWHAPSTLPSGPIVVKATIVKDYSEFYQDCFTFTLIPRQNTTDNKNLTSSSTTTSTSTSTLMSTFPLNFNSTTFVQWSYTREIVTVTIQSTITQPSKWLAIGFSVDRIVDNEYIFVCQISTNNTVQLRRMHTKLGHKTPMNSVANVTVMNTSYINSQLSCQFSFNANEEQEINSEPDPIAKDANYYIIFASGNLSQTGQLLKHVSQSITETTYQLRYNRTINITETSTSTTATSTTTNSPATTNSASSLNTSSMASPSTVTTSIDTSIGTTSTASTSNVGVALNWTYANGITSLQMSISHLGFSQWLAVGFSLDQYMGDDHVFICRHTNDDLYILERYANPSDYAPPQIVSITDDIGGVFTVNLQRIENGIAYFEFTLAKFSNGKLHQRLLFSPIRLSQQTPYYPIIAFGQLSSAAVLLKHASNSRTVQSTTVKLNQPGSISLNFQAPVTSSITLMKAHGIIMIFAWIQLMSTGILFARYCKGAWSSVKICNKPIWFAVHRIIMPFGASLTILGFVLILIYKGGTWVSGKRNRELIHSILGILVIAVAIIQPIMALFRCKPDEKNRFIFNYAHSGVGIIGLMLSIPTIFLPMFFTGIEYKLQNPWSILAAWICWLVIIVLGFECLEYCLKNKPKKEEIDESNWLDLNEQTNVQNNVERSLPVPLKIKDYLKAAFIILHILAAIALSLALVIVIGQAS